MNDFEKAFQRVIVAEGGITNDPHDSGGLTKFGISQKSFPTLDIANLTLQGAKDIYYLDYWLAAKCDLLPYPLSAFVFDAAVNQGTSMAKKMLQEAARVKADGVIGPVTLDAVKNDPDIAHKFMTERALRYFGTSGFYRFGHGWLNRIFKLAREA